MHTLWVTSMIGAIITGLVCLAPPTMVVLLGSGAVAFVPPWADFVFLPIFVTFTGLAFFLWYRARKKRIAAPD